MAKLYGVGVGPGDPRLLTIKAYKIIAEAEVIAFAEIRTAYRIAEAAYPAIGKKTLLSLQFHMTKDEVLLEASYSAAAKKIEAFLEKGRDVVYLTLGDPSIYASYLYLQRRILEAGYEAEMVPGIPSFCAAAARLGIGLCEQEECLHIIPASYEIEEALGYKGTKILMKAGRQSKTLKERLREEGFQAYAAVNCGMDNEMICRSLDELPDQPGYYTTMIIKEKRMKKDE
ncbi:MAG: precorrin-2 C(20)-methyltransferase [Johnsonella sp.]|nr:precorrin-2 C(20)-methyltransferase [Johnsonella sp.]